jgi:hypothetical protein
MRKPIKKPLMQRHEQNTSSLKALSQIPARQIGWKEEQFVLERNGKGL